MPQSFTPVLPVTDADVDANLALQLPLGSETRLVAGLYSMTQKMLNMAATAAVWWKGGTLGDSVNAGDNSKRLTIWNPCAFKSNLDVEDADMTAVNVSALDTVAANTLVHSYQDITAVRDFSAGRNAAIGGTLGVTGQASFSGGASVAGAFNANGGINANGTSALHAVTATDITASGKLTGKHIDVAVLGADADTTYQIASKDLVLIPDGSSILTADRTYTIGTTGASDGMSCTFSNQSTAHKITLIGLPAHPGGLDLKVASGFITELTVIMVAGVVCSYLPCPTP